eukprot:TRINITY_DN5164_c0_g1_i5.p1 TRINITY_DN5164_c0_g1~~TRINITY_DN5164_c0_g1_i5.p1  ORF type:complete len:783 (+),score=112.96 TRINITY_DN5164_c0_g1_i5:64-2412(+)
MASINDFTPWWEYSILGVVLSAYLMLTLFALRNRWSRPKVAEKSGAMTECEQYSVDLVRHVAPSVAVQEYRFRGMHPKTSPIDIQFENLSVTLKSDGRCVLEGVTGEFKEGNMAAIMGPSGAGKTTFMNAVCGKAYYGTTEGEVRINGRTSSIAEIKELRGFVPQDDIVHEHLTVREQLYYSARLRNPERTSLREIDLIVEDVLHVMQLLDVQHSIVGSVENRGISGGQRKRVNIGLELAARPTVLMLDEPTSGLDATTAQSIIQSLKHLTTIGMTVIMVIHQPRYSLFTLFDEVLLLGVGGRTVYQGPSQGALPYFQGIGFQMAEHENPADWFMDVISAKIPNTRTHSHLESSTLADMWKNRSKQEIQQVQRTLQRQATESHVEVFERGLAETLQKLGISSEASSITADDLTALLGSAGVQNPSPGALAELKQRIGFQQDSVTKDRFLAFLCSLRGCVAHDALSESDSETAAEVELEADSSDSSSGSGKDSRSFIGSRRRSRPRICAQYPVLLHQSILRWARLWQQNVISIILMIVAAFVFGAQCKGKLVASSPLAPLKINLSHVALGLMTSISCLGIFGTDKAVFWRESASGIRVLAFYLARVTISLFDVLIWCYIFSAVWYLSARPGGDFWVWLMAFRLIAVSSAGWGVLISTLVPQHSSTLAVAVAILIMGGAISEPQSIAEAPGTLGEVLAFLSPFTWSSGENYLVFISRQEGGIESVSPAAMPIVNGYMHILRGGVLEKLNMSYTASAASSCAILGFLSLLLGYLGLRLSHRGKQA